MLIRLEKVTEGFLQPLSAQSGVVFQRKTFSIAGVGVSQKSVDHLQEKIYAAFSCTYICSWEKYWTGCLWEASQGSKGLSSTETKAELFGSESCLGETADLQQNLIKSLTQWKYKIVDFQHLHYCFFTYESFLQQTNCSCL